VVACLVLLVSRQFSLALNVAVFALVLLYFLHSLTFLLLPRWNPKLYGEITIALPDWLQRVAAWLSVLSMSGLIIVQIINDIQTLRVQSFSQRLSNHSLTSLELVVVWSAVGAVLYALARSQRKGSDGD
jgi:hypothetical protein